MLKFIFTALLLAFALTNSQAQSLSVPRSVKLAYKRETRSQDGRPGKNYWQNFGRYNITVSAMPPNRNIQGSEQITYINRSPDTLSDLVFKLIQNIHKQGEPREEQEDSGYFNTGLHIDSFFVNGNSKPWENSNDDLTWKPIDLTKPLLPHDSIHLSFAWHYQIPLDGSREGMIDSTTFFLAYFYPRVAVYDDYNGWDITDFEETQEFYNDFNDYTVNVKVPENYIVWATGTLQNADEVLQSDFVNRLTKSMTSDSTIHIITSADILKKNITQQNAINTWTWKVNNVTDFTIGLSNHFVWDAASVVVDDSSHRRVSMQTAYNDTGVDFKNAVQIGRFTLNWLSHKLPGIPYPYPKMTIFEGYYGMEYPMMVNENYYDNIDAFESVENHEIAHSYFPFYMGTNETRYAFMDEGWANTFEHWMSIDEFGIDKENDFYKKHNIAWWINDPGQLEDLPVITSSIYLSGNEYVVNAYEKPSLAYLAVQDLLGKDEFKKCLQAYISRWHGKHPIPWDFFNSFNDVAGRNLNWFWNNWFFSSNYMDLSIQNVIITNLACRISIQNIGGFAIPFDIQINYDDGSNEIIHKTPEIWSVNQQQAMVSFTASKKITSIKLVTGIFMDADESNNTWEAK